MKKIAIMIVLLSLSCGSNVTANDKKIIQEGTLVKKHWSGWGIGGYSFDNKSYFTCTDWKRYSDGSIEKNDPRKCSDEEINNWEIVLNEQR
jgi:hypothetical protein